MQSSGDGSATFGARTNCGFRAPVRFGGGRGSCVRLPPDDVMARPGLWCARLALRWARLVIPCRLRTAGRRVPGSLRCTRLVIPRRLRAAGRCVPGSLRCTLLVVSRRLRAAGRCVPGGLRCALLIISRRLRLAAVHFFCRLDGGILCQRNARAESRSRGNRVASHTYVRAHGVTQQQEASQRPHPSLHVSHGSRLVARLNPSESRSVRPGVSESTRSR